ncbi:MAG TPA: hypothetical protein VLQ45_19140 [Thermoanaerobaculia bacterium]|nr:hypothetical protein [Thermoanaerobaculia bacterium]
MPLADLQRELAASLAAGARHAPEGLDASALGRARRALESKRRRAARHLLPRLHAALGDRWEDCFHAHATRYTPAGLLHHVDDAWELAEATAREDRSLWSAAQDDLLALKLRWTRNRKADAGRIRERRGLIVAIRRGPPRRLVVRLPGIRGKTLSLRLRLSGVADLLHSES